MKTEIKAKPMMLIVDGGEPTAEGARPALEGEIGHDGDESITAESTVMKEVLEVVRKVAPTRALVLLVGESGTGKEFLARAIHQLSPRANQPLVTANCAAPAGRLLESELFGCEKGAFPGAHETRIGRLEQARGGTLVLGEIDQMDALAQVKLLRYLVEGTFERVGSHQTLSADARLITATSKDLEREVKAGRFREDLYMLLRVVEITLPPLRQRPDDIARLAKRFLLEFASENNKPAADFTPECFEALLNYSWPGNVRELRAALEHAVVFSTGERLCLRDLPGRVRAAALKPNSGGPAGGPEVEEGELGRPGSASGLKEGLGTRMFAPNEPGVSRRPMLARTTHDRIQKLMWGLEAGTGARILKMCGIVIAFILLALGFNWGSERVFSNPEAMESAQLGRHLAAWRGYTTYSIRPSTIGLLQSADPVGAADVLQSPVPDLSIAPGYPFVLACLMKVLPFNFAANRGRLWSYQPELLIICFNEALFFAAVLALFMVARRLFDSRVAWVSAILLAGSETYWKFSVSGLSTIWLLLLLLLMVWCLAVMEKSERREGSPARARTLALAAAVGALAGIGGLSRYSFAWMMVPVLLYLRLYCKRHWQKLSLWAGLSFLVFMVPWIARNVAVSGTPFGTAGYALWENTKPLEEDRVERSFDSHREGLAGVKPWDVANKFFVNEGKILKTELPRLGGNWAWSFFLCGLLLPLRQTGLRRLRWFLIWSLALLAVVQPLVQTHLAVESPEINSENLLVLLAPLVMVFGTGFFFTLLDQTAIADRRLRGLVAGFFTVVMCAPLLLDLAARPDRTVLSPYNPVQIQRTAAMMKPDELMMSDVPWAVAWYGDRPCAWLTLNAGNDFDKIDRLKPVEAVYLTQRTSDRPFLSGLLGNGGGWGRFLLNSLPESTWPHGQVPGSFPLTQAPPGYAPVQMFLSDKVRWRTAP